MNISIKRRTFEILESVRENDRAGKIFHLFIMTLISLSIISVILETVQSIETEFGQLLKDFELFSVIIFTIEYLLRLWTCTYIEKFKRPVIGRLKYIISPMALIDLVAVLPFYLPMIVKLDLRFVRILRLVRIFRIFKMGRYSKSLKMVGGVFRSTREELTLAIGLAVIILVLASCIMYYIEHAVQPEAFASIPETMWWGVTALTTVGYGDIYPKTALGKMFGALIAFIGIGMFALPAGILGSGFVEEFKKNKKEQEITCPHCGKKIS
jgi:voltage-gated potassium channel